MSLFCRISHPTTYHRFQSVQRQKSEPFSENSTDYSWQENTKTKSEDFVTAEVYFVSLSTIAEHTTREKDESQRQKF